MKLKEAGRKKYLPYVAYMAVLALIAYIIYSVTFMGNETFIIGK